MSEAPEEPRMVQCRKLGKLLPGLKRKPYRNELGQRIYDEVSQEAWDLWLKESVRFINTYRVDLASPEGQKFMLKQAAIFFGFEQGDLAETAWTPPKPGGLRALQNVEGPTRHGEPGLLSAVIACEHAGDTA